MKKAILVLIVSLFCAGLNAQTIKKTAEGNYIQQKRTTDSIGGKVIGSTFTTSKGDVYPIYLSVNGKAFVIRTSKTGNKYKQYLKLD